MKSISEGLLIYISRWWEVNLFLNFSSKIHSEHHASNCAKKMIGIIETQGPWAEWTIDHLSKGLWKLEKNVRKHLWMMEPRIIWKVIKIGAGNSTHFFVQYDKLCKWLWIEWVIFWMLLLCYQTSQTFIIVTDWIHTRNQGLGVWKFSKELGF